MPPHLEPTTSDIFREAAIMTYTMADEPKLLETDVDLRRLLDLACDWYWTLDAQSRLIRLRGRQLDDGPNFMHAQLGKRPWEWAGVVVDAPDPVDRCDVNYRLVALGAQEAISQPAEAGIDEQQATR